jgi:hypothetical protein
LKALVGIMGALIIIGTSIVVGTIIHRLYNKFLVPPTVETASPYAPPPPGAVAVPTPNLYATPSRAVTLPKGTHIQSIAPLGQGLAILTTSPQGDAVLLLDPDTGAVHTELQSAP